MAVPALMALGFIFAMLREWRGSLIAPITAHALNNGMVVTALLILFGA
jgi:membrane protease YdiL (CAAX protease family)